MICAKSFFGCLLIIAQLQTPECCAQDEKRQNQQENIAKYIHCAPQTTVEDCPQHDVYRNITGACNNRKRPTLGVSDTAFARWLPAEYEDGVSLPQGWIEGKLYNGHPLPLVREISNKVVSSLGGIDFVDKERSQIFMEWGQWLAHDLELSSSGSLDCSSKNTCGTKCINGEPENCFPIKIPPNDPSAQTRGKCMGFTRTGPACSSATEVREQLNDVTSFLDGSALYGSQECLANMLKNTSSQLGLLAVNQRFTDGSYAYLPFDEEVVDRCPPDVFCFRKVPCPLLNTTYNIPCFIAGDKRANQNLPFLSMNTLFLREHNRLATELKRLNPHWDGQKLYLEAQKIVGALIQVITYTDYIPLVLGEWTDIELPPYEKYNDEVDPRISTAFSIAFRFAHLSIPPFVFRLDSQYKPFHPDFKIPFHEALFATWKIVMEGGIDPLLRGLLVNDARLMKPDSMMSEEFRDRLFKTAHSPGVDLAALDLQRGRELGLPSYTSWRKFCGLTVPSDMAELTAVFKSENLARKILDLYKTPENIDLWLGGTAEAFVKNGRAGPLFSCLIGSQFRKLRDGDRFWWQNPGVFSHQQLFALSHASLSRIICDNSGLEKVPRNVFKENEYPEDFVKCDTINELDLSAWIEVTAHQAKQHTEF